MRNPRACGKGQGLVSESKTKPSGDEQREHTRSPGIHGDGARGWHLVRSQPLPVGSSGAAPRLASPGGATH